MIQEVVWLTMSSMMDEKDILVLPEIVSPSSLLAQGHCGPGLDPVPQVDYWLHEKVVDVQVAVLDPEVDLKVQVLVSAILIG